MLRADPSIVRMADSSDVVLRSGIFVHAISSICLRVMRPILSRLGRAEPFSIENGLLTANGKLKRDLIAARLQHEIEEMYGVKQAS